LDEMIDICACNSEDLCIVVMPHFSHAKLATRQLEASALEKRADLFLWLDHGAV